MKTKHLSLSIAALALLALLSTLNPRLSAATIGTAFTYQGRLTAGGSAAQGIYDLQFTIYDAESGDNALGGPLTNSAVTVSNGLFTVTLDFGVGIFAGDGRWLAIGVRTNGSGAFSTLAGRQPLTPSPYAIHAADAVTASNATTATTMPWSGLSGIPGGFADAVDNDTIYTAGTGLTLAGTVFSASFGGSGAAATVSRSDHNHAAGDVVSGTLADTRLSANVALRGGGNAFTGNQSLTSGSLGIGITSPQSPLHIHQASGNSSIQLTSGASWPLTLNQSDTSIFTISNVNKPVLTMNGANVGIGTATPSAAGVAASVQVDGGYNQNSGFSIMETNGGRWALFFRGWESDNLIVRDERVSRDTMTFESGTGRVGIGTSTPATALEVADRITAGKVDGTFVNWTPGGGSVSVKRLICGSDPHAGYGVATGTDHASPIVWMYSQPGNRFEVMGMEYGQSIPSVYTRLMRVEINGDTYIARDVHVGRDAYAGVFIPTSDRNLKTNVTPVDVRQVLSGVLALPISTWDFTNSPGTRHLGPMAQDFHAAFGLGADDRHITTVDADGVALAAIQGLNQKLEEALKHRDAENAELRRRLERLEQLLAAKNGGAQ